MGDIAKNWKVLSGEKNWEGLLDPIDNNLREYLINYGSHVGAAEDSVNTLKGSAGYGLCLYPPEALFNWTGLKKGNPFEYEVTDYIYARLEENNCILYPHPKMSAYIGFVAVSTDEGSLVLGRRDIIVCWRGTTFELCEDLEIDKVSATDIFPKSKALVHRGFHSIYTNKESKTKYSKKSAREQALAAVRRLVDKYYNETVSITVTGHSLGGALATLNAADIVANGYNKPTVTGSTIEYPVICFAFAPPRVGDQGFLDVLSGLQNFHLLSIRNALDIVPVNPPKSFNYVDVGVGLEIDTRNSPYLKEPRPNCPDGLYDSHDLSVYLHGISGFHGTGVKFGFDIALVNKHGDFLLDDYKVPPGWWTQVIHKAMFQNEDGTWKEYVPHPPSHDVNENHTKY